MSVCFEGDIISRANGLSIEVIYTQIDIYTL